MSDIKIEKPTKERLESMGIFSWPVWEKEASTFPWSYDAQETCYLLEGKVKVIPEGGDPVEFGEGERVSAENFLVLLARQNGGEYRYVDLNTWSP